MRLILKESQRTKLFESEGAFVVYVMCGIPGAGKSTWCKNNLPNIPFVSRDVIRAELGYASSADEKKLLSKDAEQEVTRVEYEKMEKLCKQRKSFVVDDTNTGFFRKQLIDFLKRHNAHVVGVNIDTPLDVCIKRRDGQIPSDVMTNIYNRRKLIGDDEVDEIINVN